MTTLTILTLAAVFVSVTFLIVVAGSALTSRSESGRRRLSSMVQQQASSVLISRTAALAGESDPVAERIVNVLPTSYGSVKRLRRELALAGFYSMRSAALFSLAEVVFPVLLV